MADYYCGQCGKSTLIAGLCWGCQAHRDRLESAAEAATFAAEAIADAEYAREEQRRQKHLEQLRKELEERKAAFLQSWTLYPDWIQGIIKGV